MYLQQFNLALYVCLINQAVAPSKPDWKDGTYILFRDYLGPDTVFMMQAKAQILKRR